nr:hypothetical protein EUX21_02270 [synthetic Caulobacter sp. 'ethensis']
MRAREGMEPHMTEALAPLLARIADLGAKKRPAPTKRAHPDQRGSTRAGSTGLALSLTVGA